MFTTVVPKCFILRSKDLLYYQKKTKNPKKRKTPKLPTPAIRDHEQDARGQCNEGRRRLKSLLSLLIIFSRICENYDGPETSNALQLKKTAANIEMLQKRTTKQKHNRKQSKTHTHKKKSL